MAAPSGSSVLMRSGYTGRCAHTILRSHTAMAIVVCMSETASTEQHHCQRPGCKGILTAPESVARGMSVRCARLVRKAEAIVELTGQFKPEQLAKAMAAIRSGLVSVPEPGLFVVPSSKNDGSTYGTTATSCPCPAGAHDRKCWHLIIPIVTDLARHSRRSLAKAA